MMVAIRAIHLLDAPTIAFFFLSFPFPSERLTCLLHLGEGTGCKPFSSESGGIPVLYTIHLHPSFLL